MLSLNQRIEISPLIVIASNKEDVWSGMPGPSTVMLIVDYEIEQTWCHHLNPCVQSGPWSIPVH